VRQSPDPLPAPSRSSSPPPATALGTPSAQDLKVAILRAADALRERTAALAAGQGLTLHQYNVLRILRGARPSGLTRAQIAERTLETVPQLGDLLGDLAGRALLRTEHAEGAGDMHAITVTGTELLAGLDEPVAQADRAAMAGLSDEERATLVDLLGRIRSD
jgi:DNA-binding MarR family transcriptional regulator